MRIGLLQRGRRLASWYGGISDRAPVRVGSVTLGTLAAVGDLTAQKLEQQHDEGPFKFDSTRWSCLVAYAMIWNGPVNSQLYKGYVRLFGDGNLKAVFKALAVDQLIYMPLMAIPVSFCFKDTITNMRVDLSSVAASLRSRWQAAVVGCWAVFVPLEFINLRYVPLQFRVAMSGFMSFLWMTVLSNAQSGRKREEKLERRASDAAGPRTKVSPVKN